ncbi:MAG TPA: prepilin-type N-terminal cleavage/methylation domain-containing protein [Desulfobacterales bacterium]|nr:prepilin-type N-terminal cleavage/methylation domain-containing protein [Desulfobacterales bacterium]
MLPHKPTNHISQSGFTLIELVMTIVILGFSFMILLPFFSSISNSPDPLIRIRAVNLGQSLMDEITAKKWDNNTTAGGGPLQTAESTRVPGAPAATAYTALGPDTGETSRQLFNDVDDYNGYAETTGVFHDQDNNSFTLTGYQRSVQVRYIASTTASIDHNTPALSNTSDSKLIVVTVTSSTGEKFYFTAVRCNI